eukprot:s1296_g11.t2
MGKIKKTHEKRLPERPLCISASLADRSFCDQLRLHDIEGRLLDLRHLRGRHHFDHIGLPPLEYPPQWGQLERRPSRTSVGSVGTDSVRSGDRELERELFDSSDAEDQDDASSSVSRHGFQYLLKIKLREAMERYELRLGTRRILEVKPDYSNLVTWLFQDAVAKKYSWETVYQGKYPSMQAEAPWLCGDPKFVIPVTVPAQRIYRDGRFYLQAPGPDFAVVDCCRIFNDDTGYQAWVEALAPWLEVVSCTVCSVGHSFGQWLGLSFAKVAAAKQNKAEPWSAAVNRLLANEPPDAFVKKQMEDRVNKAVEDRLRREQKAAQELARAKLKEAEQDRIRQEEAAMQAKLKLEEEEARPSGYRYAALVSYVLSS